MERERIVRGMMILAAAVLVVFVLFSLYPVDPIQIQHVYVENVITASAAPVVSAGQDATEASSRSSADTESVVLVEKSIDLNKASLEELDRLPGVGPVLAERILAYREENDGFLELEELLEVEGIGEKTFAKLEPYLFVDREKAGF